jgi:hypothetical protein
MAYSIYKPLTNPANLADASARNQVVISSEPALGLWSGDTGSLSAIFTSSVQVANSGEFYYDLYNLNPSGSDSAEVQFAVSYGHISGSGSPQLSALNTSTLPTLVTYRQFANLLLSPGQQVFTFGPSTDATLQYTSPDIYAIVFNRARFKQALDPGNWQLGLSGSSGVKTFIDNSGLGQASIGNVAVNNSYDVVEGTIAGGPTGGSTYFGKVYPDYGLILLNPQRVSSSVGFRPSVLGAYTGSATNPFGAFTGSVGTSYQYQHEGLVRSISGSMRAGTPFLARSVEKVKSINYFVRAFADEFNYTNNPTILSSSGNVLADFRRIPKTYITTVGLYNNSNELLAVAKLSRPLEKSIDKEATIRVRLDF